MPFRDISNGGPSGSINSSAEDMARWVAVHAGRGKSGGKALISPPVLADIHAPRMTGEGPADHPGIIPVGYGLGWSVDAYRGHRRVRHGGNIDGFTAETCILPDDGLGIVVLCNMYSSPLPDLLVRHLTDRLLELDPVDWSGEALKKRKSGEDAERVAKANKDSLRRPGTSPAHALDEYAGDYYDPGYGTLSIEHRDGRLVMTHNRREAPLEHWHFEVFNALKQGGESAFEDMKVQFSTNVKGYVDAVSVPFEPSLKPIVFSRRPDKRLMNPEYLKRFTGDYELAGRTFAVKLQGDALLVGIEGAPSLELLADRDDGFEVKGMIGFRIRFLSDEGGRVKEAAFSQPEGVYMMKRK